MPEEDPNFVFKLPDSPWTYTNGSLNPSLHPKASSKTITTSTTRRRKQKRDPAVSNVPPYHPDYGKPQQPSPESDTSWDDTSEEEEDEDDNSKSRAKNVDDGYDYSITSSGLRQRRGSEGYEVRPIDREALLEQHVAETTAEPGRYHWYVPTREGAETSSEEEEGEDEDEDVSVVAGVKGELAALRT